MADRFYAWDTPTLDRAAEHGCLDEDVHTGDPLACAMCSARPSSLPSAPETEKDERDHIIAALTNRLVHQDKKRLPTIPIGARVNVRSMGVGTVVGKDGYAFDGVAVIFDPPAPRGFEEGCCAGVEECEVLSLPSGELS